QKLAETNATLNDAGTYVGSGTWSDVFTYDTRSNMTSHTDARGVKRVNNYGTDPLNRLQSISWDTSGFGDTTYPVLSAATVTYQYRQKGSPADLKDITQVEVITTAGVSQETFTYHPTEGRLTARTLRLNSRWDYPFVTDYIYDSLDRVKDMLYPAEYNNGNARRLVHHDFDVAGRLSGLTFNSQTHASNIAYNADSQVTSLTAGTGVNQVAESYSYSAQTGLMENQTLTRNGTTLLNLSYDWAGSNGKRTGQLTKITNNLDPNKNKGYEYDALGRLKRATGGQNVNWAQRYNYDRYGNRNNVFSHTADQYIRNFYQSALVRQPNSTELNTWLSTLQSAYAQGPTQFWSAMQNLGAAVFTSAEYAARQRSDHDYVYDLYRAYLWRDPDAGGWTFWEQICQSHGRNHVRGGFDWSVEFEQQAAGTSPYSPPGGATVPSDGWANLAFQTTNNRVADTDWKYDAAGNQTRAWIGGVWRRFHYDAANRLIYVKTDDNATVITANTYGSSRERLVTEENGTRTYADYEGLTPIAEYTETGGATTPSWSKSYVYAGDRLLSTVTPTGGGGTAVNYNHPDQLGTRVITTPSTGASFEQANLPFGNALNSESSGPVSPTNRRFTSYVRSAMTGLDYAYNRTYDSMQGRFTQVDPGGMAVSDLSSPQTFNLYAYCANDPINKTDPSGLGFFSFISKLFKTIHKILKWVAVAVAVAFVVVALIAGPVTALVLLLKIGTSILSKLGFVKAVPLAFTASGEVVGGGLTIGLTGKILTGLEALGTISTHLAGQKGKGKGGGASTSRVPDYVEKFFKKLGAKFNQCLKAALETDGRGNKTDAYKKVGKVTTANAPAVDRSQTSAQMGGKLGGMVDGDEKRGRFGTIRIASDIEDRPSAKLGKTVSKEELLNRTLAHEIANAALMRSTVADKVVFGDPNMEAGVEGTKPDVWDIGARVEKCVFGNIYP
ncbi:MAG TPA: RHS repeat-associated core domain-containing protein, partial [Pyrinomonadaceae bacterium]|nr:RHS repeat-associated core domain-containing protein [Pyrinomonadaceae bacterium]